MKYDFDHLADRTIDQARKWDPEIVKSKFPNCRLDFIPLWIADMDFKAAPEIREALVKMAKNGAYGYTSVTKRWLQSVINWQWQRHQNQVTADWLTLGYGTVPNLHIIVQAFTQPQDRILLNTPVYGPFAYAAQHNGRQIISVALRRNGHRYDIDWDQIETVMQTQHPKVTFFCSPHNPSGRIWNRAEITRFADLCLKYHVLMVVDEVHSEHIIQGTFTSCLQLPAKYYSNLIMLTSPNKGFNLGGLKLSYSIIPDPQIRQTFRKQNERNSVTSPNVPGQIAMIAAYEQGSAWLDQSVAYLKENLVLTEQALAADFPGWEMMTMESSYLPWIDVASSHYDMPKIATKMADEAGVIVGIGDDYVANADHFLRLNLGTSHALVEEAMQRMAKTWRQMIA